MIWTAYFVSHAMSVTHIAVLHLCNGNVGLFQILTHLGPSVLGMVVLSARPFLCLCIYGGAQVLPLNWVSLVSSLRHEYA